MSEHYETTAVHAGASRNTTSALVMPIFQSSTFKFESCEHGAQLCSSTHPDQLYTRWGNPTIGALEESLAALEGAESALAFSSGQAAGSSAVFACVKAGDHVVAGNCLYSGMTELFDNVLRSFGVDTTFVDAGDHAAFEAAIRPNTRLLYVETPANPTLSITDLSFVASLGKKHGVTTMADNTWASPFNTQPLALGIDAVVHSVTKYIAGHSDVVAGAVCGSKLFVDKVWKCLKIFGGCMSPHDAFLVTRGIKTFALRVRQQNETAMKVALFLQQHEKVETVFYPGLESHRNHLVAKQQMTGGFGGMLAFELKGGIDAGKTVAENVKLITHAVSLGGVESLICHSASTTHKPLTKEQRLRSGVTDGLMRLSIGLESSGDVIKDLEQALAKV